MSDLGTVTNYVQIGLWAWGGVAWTRKMIRDRQLELDPFKYLGNRLIGYAIVAGLIISCASLYYNFKPRVVTQTVYLPSTSKPRIIVGWGPLGPNCGFDINAAPLMIFAEKDNVAMVCGIIDATRDRFEDERITISSPFTIQPQTISIAAPYSPLMAEAVNKMRADALKDVPVSERAKAAVPISVWYEVMLIPKGTKLSNIHKLSDVVLYGGEIISQDARFN